MKDSKLVWSDEKGDLRKKNNKAPTVSAINESQLLLKVRRLTAGKGRTVVEITGLPADKIWCHELASYLKKSLGSGGAYKNDYIEIHGENMEKIIELLTNKKLKVKKIGG